MALILRNACSRIRIHKELPNMCVRSVKEVAPEEDLEWFSKMEVLGVVKSVQEGRRMGTGEENIVFEEAMGQLRRR